MCRQGNTWSTCTAELGALRQRLAAAAAGSATGPGGAAGPDGKAQATVDNAHARYFIIHAHKLLDPSSADCMDSRILPGGILSTSACV